MKHRMGGRAVEGTGLENRQSESSRGFESHPIRHSISPWVAPLLFYKIKVGKLAFLFVWLIIDRVSVDDVGDEATDDKGR